MIRLQNLCKTFRGGATVAHNLSLTLPSRTSIALLGRNGAGKSTLLRMITGTIAPDHGRVITTGQISWPVAFAGCFHGDLSGRQNVKFVARVYGMDTRSLVHVVQEFADIGAQYDAPLRTYSTGMKARLAFGLSMSIPFDTYLIDEVTSVGDASFKDRSIRILEDRLQNAGAIVVSHSPETLERICTAGMVLHNGQIQYYPKVGDALASYRGLVRASQTP